MGKNKNKKQDMNWYFNDLNNFINEEADFDYSASDDQETLHGFDSGSDVSMSDLMTAQIPDDFLEDDSDVNFTTASTEEKAKTETSEKSCSDSAEMANEELDQMIAGCMQEKVGSDAGIPEEKSKEEGVKRLSEVKMAKKYMQCFDFVNIDGTPHVYDPEYGIWRILAANTGQKLLRRLAPVEIQDAINRRSLGEILEWIAADQNVESIDSYYIDNSCAMNFRNGAFYVDSGKPVYNRKSMMFRHYIDADYVGKDCVGSLFLEFLDTTFSGNQYEIALFQEMVGYCFSEKRDLKVSFLLYGPSNSGKSVVGNLLTMLMGEEFTSDLTMSELNERFGPVKLAGKYLNVGSEMSTTSRISGDKFKRLVGNDRVNVEEKNIPGFPIRNTAVMVFLGNSFPAFSMTEDPKSINERIVFLPFLNSVPRENWIPQLDKKLFEEASFIASWAMKGWARLRKSGYVFTRCRAAELLRAQYLSKSFSEYYFVTKYLQADPCGKVSTQELNLRFKNFCLAIEIPVRERVSWYDVLSKEFVVQSIRGIDFCEQKNLRGFSGVSFKKGGLPA